MSIISALRSMLGMSEKVREEVRREINFFEVIEAHVSWKQRLLNYLQGRSEEKLEPHVIGVDNRCALGIWIHGPGKERFSEIPLFQKLNEEHAKFHYFASHVVEAFHSGDAALAEKLLHHDFAKQSKLTVDCLTKLHAQVEGKA